MAGITGCVLELDGAVCIACFVGLNRTYSSLLSGRFKAGGVLRELSKITEVCSSCQLNFFRIFLIRIDRLAFSIRPVTTSDDGRTGISIHSTAHKMSKHRNADKGAELLAPGRTKFLCSSLGLESSSPLEGFASWIKRLDCASSYSSAGRFPPFPADPPYWSLVKPAPTCQGAKLFLTSLL